MKLIVGLGNPGKEYEGTRHNIGFMVLDKYALKKGLNFNRSKFNADYVEFLNKNDKIILLKPMEYINLSGQSISKIVKFFKVEYDDILIIHDDLDIKLGKYKLKLGGNDGGHNGIKSIISNLGNNNIKRLKIGIDNDREQETKDYVLGKLKGEEKKEINEIIEKSCNIIDDFIELDFLQVMNKYN